MADLLPWHVAQVKEPVKKPVLECVRRKFAKAKVWLLLEFEVHLHADLQAVCDRLLRLRQCWPALQKQDVVTPEFREYMLCTLKFEESSPVDL